SLQEPDRLISPGGQFLCNIECASSREQISDPRQHPAGGEGSALIISRGLNFAERYAAVVAFLDEIDRADRLLAESSTALGPQATPQQRGQAITSLREQGIGFDAASIAVRTACAPPATD
ncbi:MAG: hypothetical protein ACO31E_10490, partial [Phycisphaerales bacterium]